MLHISLTNYHKAACCSYHQLNIIKGHTKMPISRKSLKKSLEHRPMGQKEKKEWEQQDHAGRITREQIENGITRKPWDSRQKREGDTSEASCLPSSLKYENTVSSVEIIIIQMHSSKTSINPFEPCILHLGQLQVFAFVFCFGEVCTKRHLHHSMETTATCWWLIWRCC